MGRLLAVLLAAMLCWMPVTWAAPQIITATGTYIMGDNDSPKIAKQEAREEAMRSASEQAGVYVESYSETQNLQLTADDVKVVSAAVLRVINEDARPALVNGMWQYTVTITAEVDTDNLDLQGILKNRQDLQAAQQECEALRKENAELQEKNRQAQDQEQDQAQIHPLGQGRQQDQTQEQIWPQPQTQSWPQPQTQPWPQPQTQPQQTTRRNTGNLLGVLLGGILGTIGSNNGSRSGVIYPSTGRSSGSYGNPPPPPSRQGGRSGGLSGPRPSSHGGPGGRGGSRRH